MSECGKAFSDMVMSCGNEKSCWGPLIWKRLEATCSLIPCDTCREHCEKMIRFEHDLVNVHLGKPLFDPANFTEYLSTVSMTAGRAAEVMQ